MNFTHLRSTLGALAVALTVTTAARATPITFNNLPATNILGGNWESGDLTLPTGTTVGPSSSVELLLSLMGDVTTTSGGDFGAGVLVQPPVAPGGEVVGFNYQLTENGANVGSSFGATIVNMFGQGESNAMFTTSTGLPSGVVFNGIDVTLTNSSNTENVSDFTAFIGGSAVQVPDTSATLVLLLFGSAALAAMALGTATRRAAA